MFQSQLGIPILLFSLRPGGSEHCPDPQTLHANVPLLPSKHWTVICDDTAGGSKPWKHFLCHELDNFLSILLFQRNGFNPSCASTHPVLFSIHAKMNWFPSSVGLSMGPMKSHVHS